MSMQDPMRFAISTTTTQPTKPIDQLFFIVVQTAHHQTLYREYIIEKIASMPSLINYLFTVASAIVQRDNSRSNNHKYGHSVVFKGGSPNTQ